MSIHYQAWCREEKSCLSAQFLNGAGSFQINNYFSTTLFLFTCNLTLFLQDNNRMCWWQSSCICVQQMFWSICFPIQKELPKLPRMIIACKKYLFNTSFILLNPFSGSFLALSFILIQWAECKKNKNKNKKNENVEAKSYKEKVKCKKVWKLLEEPRYYWPQQLSEPNWKLARRLDVIHWLLVFWRDRMS